MLNHDRIEMLPVHMRKSWVCPTCKTEVTGETIMRSVPSAYKPQIRDSGLQQLLDFDILGVVMSNGKILIEYPRGYDV